MPQTGPVEDKPAEKDKLHVCPQGGPKSTQAKDPVGAQWYVFEIL